MPERMCGNLRTVADTFRRDARRGRSLRRRRARSDGVHPVDDQADAGARVQRPMQRGSSGAWARIRTAATAAYGRRLHASGSISPTTRLVGAAPWSRGSSSFRRQDAERRFVAARRRQVAARRARGTRSSASPSSRQRRGGERNRAIFAVLAAFDLATALRPGRLDVEVLTSPVDVRADERGRLSSVKGAAEERARRRTTGVSARGRLPVRPVLTCRDARARGADREPSGFGFGRQEHGDDRDPGVCAANTMRRNALRRTGAAGDSPGELQ